LFSAVVVTALLVLLEVALLPALAIGALSGLGAFFLYQRAGRKPAGNSRRSNARRSHETGTGYVAGAHGAGWDGGADGGGGFDGGAEETAEAADLSGQRSGLRAATAL
jgi:hypothetical protein